MANVFISSGLNMVDTVAFLDGRRYADHIGGIPMYGFAGMRPWTKAEDIVFMARVGKDFESVYGGWMDANSVRRDAIKYVAEECPRCVMYMDENFDMIPGTLELSVGDYVNTDLFRPTLEDYKEVVTDETKGLYICGAQVGAPALPASMWDGFFEFKKLKNFKVMWEANAAHISSEDHESADAMFDLVEMLSFNLPESKNIFELDSEEKILRHFRSKKNCELILLRCGSRGLYSISEGNAWFIPSVKVPLGEKVVDTTGCGNTSTAGAMAAWCKGCDPVMAGIKANISANYNLRQTGPRPVFTDELMDEAEKLATDIYKEGGYQRII